MVAQELAKIRERAGQEALEEENKVIEQINLSVENFLRQVEEANQLECGGRKLNLNVGGIRENNDRLVEEIRG